MKRWGLLWALVLALPVWAGDLQIREGYVREMPPGQSTTAAFMKVMNTGKEPIALIAAISDSAQTAELHMHKHADGMMQMTKVSRLEIPAQRQVEFAPGGYHLMLINLKRTLHAGDKVSITLFDERGKSYSAQLPVVKMTGAAGASH
jgi:periplasmic copper chaperone A